MYIYIYDLAKNKLHSHVNKTVANSVFCCLSGRIETVTTLLLSATILST